MTSILVLAGMVIIALVLYFVFSKLIQNSLKNVSEQLSKLVDGQFKVATGQIDVSKQDIKHTVDKLQEQLDRYEKMVKEFESDRTKKYGSLEQQISQATKETSQLHATTAHLTSILANVKQRGQWGERMAEDILKYCGLQEGLHFLKQQTLDSNTLRPDYTFLLPDDHKVVMDVKFPLNKYMVFVNSTNEAEREQLKKAFLDDVKLRIREVASKDYRPAGDSTLDYVLLFIPNEQVYGFINEELPGLIDETLSKKIILCSPWTLYAVLRIIWQAWNNYHHSEGLKKIISVINEFKKEFNNFRESMDTVGDRLDKAQKAYQEMVGVRLRQLDKKIDKIDQYGSGQIESQEVPVLIDDDTDAT
ncbi:MAG: DNA recombination protein RmuC [Candidatus Omnitrophica bacterium]|nr:DNA recombination protein RmuC [Candidatus Omnitrophota bacterium]